MNAIELARQLEDYGIGTESKKQIVAELRRLAAIEEKYNAIMEQIPVAYISAGGLQALAWEQAPTLFKHRKGKAKYELIVRNKDD